MYFVLLAWSAFQRPPPSMHRLLVYLLTAFALTACSDDVPNAARTSGVPPSTSHDAEVTYEADSESTPTPEPDDSDGATDPTARPAAQARAKLTLQYMNNETEIFRPSAYDVRLWWFNDEPPLTNYSDGSAVASRYAKPTFLIQKKANGRSYTRKMIYAGWYIAEFDASGHYLKFQVGENSNGLLCYNENSFTSVLFRGYYPNFGKIKCSWKGCAFQRCKRKSDAFQRWCRPEFLAIRRRWFRSVQRAVLVYANRYVQLHDAWQNQCRNRHDQRDRRVSTSQVFLTRYLQSSYHHEKNDFPSRCLSFSPVFPDVLYPCCQLYCFLPAQRSTSPHTERLEQYDVPDRQ